MAWEFDHIFGEVHGVIGAADVDEVADEPFVVVGEVVDLVGEDAVAHHVGVVNTGGGFLLVDGIFVAFEAGIDVARHVPHVSDTGSRLPAAGGRVEGFGSIFVIPGVNAVVMGGVHWVFGEDGLHEGFLVIVRRIGYAFADALPLKNGEEGFGFDVVGVLLDDFFEVFDVTFAALFFGFAFCFAVVFFVGLFLVVGLILVFVVVVVCIVGLIIVC